MTEIIPTRVYFDHAATTPLTPAALDAMRPHLVDEHGNPSSVHVEGQRARAALEEARAVVGEALGVADEELVFTGSGTEAANLALRGTCWMASAGSRPHLVTTTIEHPAVLRTARWLEARGDAEVTWIAPMPDGVVVADEVLAAVREDTALVSVMAVNNELGTVQPVGEVGGACRERGVAFHVDAVQALGRLPLAPDAIPADLVTLSAHKVGGPKGVGLLWSRRGVKLQPVITGGEQEFGMRAGTEPVAAIAGAARAVADAAARSEEATARVASVSRALEDGLLSIPGVHLNGSRDARVPGIINVSFEGADGEAVLQSLDIAGFAVSRGSACTAGSTAPSHVLKALGVSESRARGAIRFSLAESNRTADVERLLAELPRVLETVRARVGS